MKRMTAMEFITSAFADYWTHEQPQPITIGQAAEMIRDWSLDGAVDVPATVTPLLFCRTWNILVGRTREAIRDVSII